MNNLYITYDASLKRHLRECKINDVLYGLNPKSLKMFWVYDRTEELESILKRWFDKKQ